MFALEYDTGAVLRRITVSLAGARRALSLTMGATDTPSGNSRNVLVTDRIGCFCFSPPQPPNMVLIRIKLMHLTYACLETSSAMTQYFFWFIVLLAMDRNRISRKARALQRDHI